MVVPGIIGNRTYSVVGSTQQVLTKCRVSGCLWESGSNLAIFKSNASLCLIKSASSRQLISPVSRGGETECS